VKCGLTRRSPSAAPQGGSAKGIGCACMSSEMKLPIDPPQFQRRHALRKAKPNLMPAPSSLPCGDSPPFPTIAVARAGSPVKARCCDEAQPFPRQRLGRAIQCVVLVKVVALHRRHQPLRFDLSFGQEVV